MVKRIWINWSEKTARRCEDEEGGRSNLYFRAVLAFFSALSYFGACTMFICHKKAMIQFLKRLLHIGSYRHKENLLIFVGDFGVQALNQHRQKWKEHTHFLAVNSDWEHLHTNVGLPKSKKLHIGLKNHRGSHRKFRYGLRCVYSNKRLILRKIKTFRFRRIVLAGALRNSSASGIIPALAVILKNRGIETRVIVSTPFVNEGTTAEINTAKASDMLAKLDIPTTVIAMSQQAIHPDKTLIQSLAECFGNAIEKELVRGR